MILKIYLVLDQFNMCCPVLMIKHMHDKTEYVSEDYTFV